MLHFVHNPRIRAHAGEVVSSSPGGRKFWMCWSSICMDEKASPNVSVQSKPRLIKVSLTWSEV